MKTHFYDLRFRSYEWARIWVTSDGMISICSDYGNFGYWFGAPAMEIRRFLVQADPGPGGYIAIKLSDGERAYDCEATLLEVKKYILDHRRSGDWDHERARDEWELLRQNSWLGHRDEFHNWYLETKIDCAHEFFQDMLPGKVQGFMEHAWPVFVKAMKTEIAAEEARSAAFGIMQEMGV